MPDLRLVETSDTIVPFDVALARAKEEGSLKASAAAFAAVNGPNAYSDFVLKHGRRPDPAHAAVLGRVIGKRVRASDGSLQPRATKGSRQACRNDRACREAYRQDLNAAERVKRAIRVLAENKASIADLLKIMGESPSSLDLTTLGAQLDAASNLLSRFSREIEHANSDDGALQSSDGRSA